MAAAISGDVLTLPTDRCRIGARWDDASQSARFAHAKERGLLAYQEVNYPISAAEDPTATSLPILAHTSNNPVASIHGIDGRVAAKVKAGADASDSPWIGEHLSWLGYAESGALGYVLNPLLTDEFCGVSVANVIALRAYYGRPVALELGPFYSACTGDFASEMHFLGEVARRADTHIILDVTHWTISNRNLGRADDYGLDALDADRVVELHVAGIRKSGSGSFWHDAHGLPVPDEIIAVTHALVKRFPKVRAITLEHSMEGSESDFYSGLERLGSAVS